VRVAPIVLRISASALEAEIRVDGRRVGTFTGEPIALRDLGPGEHIIEVSAPGYQPWRRELELDAGENRDLEAGLTPMLGSVVPPPPRGGVSPLVWVGAGVLVLGGATTLVFGIRSRLDPVEGVNRADAVSFHEDRQRDARLANAGLGVMGVGAAVAITGFIVSEFGGSQDSNHAFVAPVPGGAVAGFEGRL
jgi:hypothetical protein